MIVIYRCVYTSTSILWFESGCMLDHLLKAPLESNAYLNPFRGYGCRLGLVTLGGFSGGKSQPVTCREVPSSIDLLGIAGQEKWWRITVLFKWEIGFCLLSRFQLTGAKSDAQPLAGLAFEAV